MLSYDVRVPSDGQRQCDKISNALSILYSAYTVHFVQPQFVLGEENLILQASSDTGG